MSAREMTSIGVERTSSKTFRLVSPKYSRGSIRMGARVEQREGIKGGVTMKRAKKLAGVDESDFASVLDIITMHRSRALMSVNVESLITYWEIGAFLSPRIHSGSWSTAVVGRLADYIKRNKPELRGYGKSNLYNMARVYDLFSDESFLSLTTRYKKQLPAPDNFFQLQNGKSLPTVLALTSYTNLVIIANHCRDAQECLFYIVYASREHLKNKELARCIETDSYTSLLGGSKKNYSNRLKELYPTAPVVIKDRAFLDYLALPERCRESKLRREIVSHIKDFILEMGKEFLFVDQEYTLPVGGEDFHSDLLFYHRGLQCLVAFELKTRKFRPSDMGQLEFYLEALDRDMKKENENPSIGIILCRDANRIVVEYAMSRAMSPVMVAQYKRLLIPKEVLQRTFEEYLELPVVSC
jgi:predicted nuclease of restriction endonuclease-like (RecB) superfamily